MQIAIAHIAFSISYVAIIVRARAVSLDPRMEEAARDLGASPAPAFLHVTLPLVAPAVAAGALIAFALSFDDLIITSFNAGVGSSTLPLYIYSRIRFGVTPEINAISTIVVVATAVAILVAMRGARRRGRGRAARGRADARRPKELIMAVAVARPPLEPIRTPYRVRFLEDDQLDRLQEATLRILEDVGVKFPSAMALEILATTAPRSTSRARSSASRATSSGGRSPRRRVTSRWARGSPSTTSTSRRG